MVIQTALHSQNDSLNHHEVGQTHRVSPQEASKEAFLQQLLSYDKVIQSKAEAREGRTSAKILRRHKKREIKEVRRSDHRRYCPTRQQSYRRKNKQRSESRAGYRFASSPRICVLRNISLSSEYREAIHAPIPQVTVGKYDTLFK